MRGASIFYTELLQKRFIAKNAANIKAMDTQSKTYTIQEFRPYRVNLFLILVVAVVVISSMLAQGCLHSTPQPLIALNSVKPPG